VRLAWLVEYDGGECFPGVVVVIFVEHCYVDGVESVNEYVGVLR